MIGTVARIVRAQHTEFGGQTGRRHRHEGQEQCLKRHRVGGSQRDDAAAKDPRIHGPL